MIFKSADWLFRKQTRILIGRASVIITKHKHKHLIFAKFKDFTVKMKNNCDNFRKLHSQLSRRTFDQRFIRQFRFE